MLWAIQVALATHWQASGVRPDAVIGCGPGEIAAAQVAGLITPGTAARLACSDRGHGLAGPRSTAEPVPVPQDAPAFRSAITGKVMSGAELDAAHWVEALGGTGRRADLAGAVAAEVGRAHVVFLEIGTTPTLSGQIRLALAGSGAENAVVLPRQEPGQPGRDALVRLVIATTASLYEAGADIAWANYYPHRAAAEQIPTYPWQRQHVWFQANA